MKKAFIEPATRRGSRLAGVGLFILALGLVPSAEAQLPAMFIGANVEASNVCPSCSHYIKTNRGDLFDLAKQAGWNTFRLTQYETWRTVEMNVPYSAQNWTDIYTRAQATNIFLIVVLEGYNNTTEHTAIDNVPTDQRVTVRLSYDEPLIDSILQPLPSVQRCNVAVDLGNEEEENPANDKGEGYSRLTVYQDEAQYIRSKYPGVSITVGGWKLNGAYNHASDGAPYQSLEDFISAHYYPDVYSNNSPATDTAAVLTYFTTVNSWSNDKPILLGEYGSLNGVMPLPTGGTACTTCSPSAQAGTNAATVEGVVQAKQQGINAAGALVWSYYPRGTLGPPVNNLSGSDNEDVVLVPDGPGGTGLPIDVLPAASVLCPVSMNCPAFPAPLTQQ